MAWYEPANIYNTIDSIIRSSLGTLEDYFRLELDGTENVPQGQTIIYANHSGFNGLDALLLSYSLQKYTGRQYKLVAHPFWFQLDFMAEILGRYGIIYAGKDSVEETLLAGDSIIIFPEAEDGNFKSSFDMYKVQKFRSGLVRLALRHELPVVPCTILGAEESAITLNRFKFQSFFKHGLTIPLPVNAIPLPAKWQIRLHSALDTTKYKGEYQNDPKTITKITRMWRKRLQILIYRELKKRKGIFIDRD